MRVRARDGDVGRADDIFGFDCDCDAICLQHNFIFSFSSSQLFVPFQRPIVSALFASTVFGCCTIFQRTCVIVICVVAI